jgi:GDP-L-fucose synthase
MFMKIAVFGATSWLAKFLLPLFKEPVDKFGYTKAEVHLLGPDCTHYRDLVNGVPKLPARYDLVINLSGYNGGISLNLQKPYDLFYRNTLMNLNLIEACVRTGVGKLVSLVASCAYPDCGDELKEEAFLQNCPNPSVMGHAYAKRNLQLASMMAHKQYGLKAVCLCPSTPYGPQGSIDESKEKVLNGLILRFLKAKKKNEKITIWGTGKPLREFIYIEDLAQLIYKAAFIYEDCTRPLNLGNGAEYSINALVEQVRQGTGYLGDIIWDETKPDGQFRKKLNTKKMKQFLGDFPFTSLQNGIQKTVEYYENIL